MFNFPLDPLVYLHFRLFGQLLSDISDLFGSPAVRYLIYLARESRYWAKRKLSPISIFPCQMNQMSGKQLSKPLLYFSAQNVYLMLIKWGVIISRTLLVHRAQLRKRGFNSHTFLWRSIKQMVRITVTLRMPYIKNYCLTKISIRAKRSISRIFSLFIVPSPFFVHCPYKGRINRAESVLTGLKPY